MKYYIIETKNNELIDLWHICAKNKLVKHPSVVCSMCHNATDLIPLTKNYDVQMFNENPLKNIEEFYIKKESMLAGLQYEKMYKLISDLGEKMKWGKK
jgi:hypothetical protein